MPAPPHNSKLAAVVAYAAVALTVVAMLAPLVEQVLRPLVLGGEMPTGLSRWSGLVLSLCSLGVAALFAGTVHRRVNTQLLEHGVRVPGLGKPRLYAWSEFNRVSGKGMQIKLHTAAGSTITVNVLCYSPPGAVVPFLGDKLAKQLFAPPGAS